MPPDATTLRNSNCRNCSGIRMEWPHLLHGTVASGGKSPGINTFVWQPLQVTIFSGALIVLTIGPSCQSSTAKLQEFSAPSACNNFYARGQREIATTQTKFSAKGEMRKKLSFDREPINWVHANTFAGRSGRWRSAAMELQLPRLPRSARWNGPRPAPHSILSGGQR